MLSEGLEEWEGGGGYSCEDEEVERSDVGEDFVETQAFGRSDAGESDVGTAGAGDAGGERSPDSGRVYEVVRSWC